MQRGDILALYTDGITEAINGTNKQFGAGRLDEVLRACGLDASEIVTATVEALARFTNDTPPLDDQTLLVAKIT
jgi:phosphoserine phosphatase RsbU/P